MMRVVFLAGWVAAGAVGCGNGGGAGDAGTDGFDACPGMRTVEVLTADLTTRESLFEVTATQAGAPENEATSAPNGRLVLCLPGNGDEVIEFSRADLLTTRMTLAGELGSVQGIEVPLSSAAGADALVESLGETRDGGATTLVVDFTDDIGDPATGAQLSAPAGDGAFARQAGGGFAAGNTVVSGPSVLVVNVAGESAALTVDGAGGCQGPEAATLESGGIAYVFFRCP